MTTFYHVSRADISKIQTFDLKPINQIAGWMPFQGLYTRDDFGNLLAGLYTAGITQHGIEYLYRYFGVETANNGVNYVEYSPMIEIAFELIRQLKFPKKKSRFEIVFGCRSLEEAQALRATTFNGIGSIYAVECENYSIADMNLTKTGNNIAGTFLLAEKYWAGESSQNPFWEVLMQPPVRILRLV